MAEQEEEICLRENLVYARIFSKGEEICSGLGFSFNKICGCLGLPIFLKGVWQW